MRRMGWAGIAMAAAALAVGGCGDVDASGARGEVPAETVDVSLREFLIDPDGIQVDSSGLVAFEVTNDGEFPHAFEIEGNGLEEETETLEPSDSETLTVELADGTYKVYCPVDDHEGKGMVGTLVVGEGTEAGSGSTTSDGATSTEGEGDDGDDDSSSDGGSSSSY